ncbi:hypothetical protein IGI04_029736 [Brassica rapa subsp. trilocularis]|uniref:Uncharacterized protein n=1 Tax=Brassica rapa subsp. trilocularis TaxID=1813537 RepID=A0ABQ7LRF4_BRACM|nr:hypothetical protein IGI04_029736 [Brassica rapa subsp. trilocularis]
MASRWWDPGDLGVGGEFSSRVGFGLVGSKVVLILRWFGLKRDKGIRERFRNHGILGDLLAILILIKKVSQSREVSGIFVWVFGCEVSQKILFCQSLPGIVMVNFFHRCYALPWSYYIRILGSLLLGNVGVSNNGEGTRKRLKISVLHFDNFALIKTYSKTSVDGIGIEWYVSKDYTVAFYGYGLWWLATWNWCSVTISQVAAFSLELG